MARIIFAIEIKKCACTRSKKFCSIENSPEWKTALKLSSDTNITLRISLRNNKLKYIFTSGRTDTLFESKI